MLNLKDLFVLILTVSLVWWWRRKPLRDFAAKLPGLNGLPLIGVLHKFYGIDSEDIYSRVNQLSQNFKKTFKVWMGPYLMLVVRDADDLKTIYTSEECFDKVNLMYDQVLDFGLLVLGGNTYKLHRKTYNPVFYPAQLRSYFPIIKRKMDGFIERFDSRLEPGKEVEFSHFTTDFTLESILATMFANDDITEAQRTTIIDAIESFLLISCEKAFKWYFMFEPIFRFSKLYSAYHESRAEMNKFAEILIEHYERDYQRKVKSADRKPEVFLDAFYGIRETMTLKQTKESVITFLIGGFDTTGKAIPSILLLLAMHPKAQEKVFRELKRVFASDNYELTEEDFNEMEYLEMVIKESLRLIPLVLMLARTVKKDIQLKEFMVPKGTFVACLTRDLHTDENYWGEDANKFKPERFSGENYKNINPNAYMPFSRGPRICPGHRYAWLSMRIFLSKFLLKYKVTTELKLDELEYQLILTTKVKQGFMLKVHRR